MTQGNGRARNRSSGGRSVAQTIVLGVTHSLHLNAIIFKFILFMNLISSFLSSFPVLAIAEYPTLHAISAKDQSSI